jgi:bleomycin hydrolase
MKLSEFLCLSLLVFVVYCLQAQPAINTNKKGGGYTFTIEKSIVGTPVKNQARSGTCWCFSTSSFIESEVMRLGKGNVHLSEMFVVRAMYIQKAEHYVRYHGAAGFGEGGEMHDVTNAIREYGMIPYDVYSGMPPGQEKPTQEEMAGVLKAMLDVMIKTPDGSLNVNWKAAFIGALDGYMGVPPDTFTYQGKRYTPKSFAASLEIKPDDYVEITSFTHHPFYTSFIFEVPDNWANGKVYNVPLDELKHIADNAIANNYSIAWASDVSERGFSFKNGVAYVPATDYDNMTPAEKDSMFTRPLPEKTITQELRQKAFDNLTTTDDHGMQIIGTAKDQDGNDYYLVKNSWGTERNDLEGYFYASVPYFEYKTTSIMVNKHALPKDIARKLGIKI